MNEGDFYGVKYKAKKSLGQHFLKNENVVKQIVAAGQIKKDDNILEIGPGFGFLTEKIVQSPARRLYLCEKDDDLCKIVKDKYSSSRIKVICADALTLIPSLQVEEPFKVISNLPYNISSPVIISLLTVCPTLPSKMVLMLQKEVAQRLVAKPGDSNRGWLTVLIEMMARAEIIINVSRYDFSPPPQVESSVIMIDLLRELDKDDLKKIVRLLKAGFSGKRKKIRNSIFKFFKVGSEESVEVAKICSIDLNDRAEDLTAQQWLSLYEEFKKRGLFGA